MSSYYCLSSFRGLHEFESHLAMEHFVTDHETYMGSEAVILLLRTIAAFEVAHRIRWTPILLKQVLQGGAPLHTLLKVRHRGHTRTLLLSCVSLAEHMPAEIGVTVADVIGRVAMAESRKNRSHATGLQQFQAREEARTNEVRVHSQMFFHFFNWANSRRFYSSRTER